MPAWPATLPQFVSEQGYSETSPDNRIETQTDTGPGESRRRSTGKFRTIQCQIQCTSTQAGYFDTFYEDDLAFGSLTFTWVNPITQAAKTFKFKGGPPRKSVFGGNNVSISFQLTQYG